MPYARTSGLVLLVLLSVFGCATAAVEATAETFNLLAGADNS